jgi:hypothetical protein
MIDHTNREYYGPRHGDDLFTISNATPTLCSNYDIAYIAEYREVVIPPKVYPGDPTTG